MCHGTPTNTPAHTSLLTTTGAWLIASPLVNNASPSSFLYFVLPYYITVTDYPFLFLFFSRCATILTSFKSFHASSNTIFIQNPFKLDKTITNYLLFMLFLRKKQRRKYHSVLFLLLLYSQTVITRKLILSCKFSYESS